MSIKVEILAMCLINVPNDWYLENIGFDTLVFRTKENKKIVLKQKDLLKKYTDLLHNSYLTN